MHRLLRHRPPWAVVLCFSLTVLPFGARADGDARAAALISKHAAFLGWTFGDPALRTLRLEGTEAARSTASRRLPYRFVRAGTARRETWDRPNGLAEDAGYTGSRQWLSDSNGFVTPVIGDIAKFRTTRAMLFDETTTKLDGNLHGAVTIDGTAYPVVRFEPPGGLTLDVAVDAMTGAYRRAVIDPGGAYETAYDILGYVEAAPGKKVIGSWRVDGVQTTVEKASAGADVTNEELHPPAQVAHWTFDDTPVPVRVTPQRVYLDATVNGVPGRFILDTGASDIFLSGSFSRRAHVAKVDVAHTRALLSDATSDVVRIDTFAVGKSVLHDVVVSAGGPDEDPDAPDGVIGFAFFAGAIVDLDFDAKTIAVHDPATSAPDTSRGVVAAVDLSDGQPKIPMKLDGSLAVEAILDSGDPGIVLFDPGLVRRGLRFLVDNSNEGYIAANRSLRDANGAERHVECGKLDSLEVGPIRYAPVSACKNVEGDSTDVLVGLEFLRGFNIVFDYPDGELLLQPRKSP